MTKEQIRREFLAKWIPYGMSLLNRAEAHGVDWEHCAPEKLLGEIVTAEEFATPDEYKGGQHFKKRLIVKA